MKLARTLLTLALATAPAAAAAQNLPETPQPSPAAKVMQRVGLTDISVEYSSPGKKGRKLWGKLVPYGKLWRTGANAATKLEVSRDVIIAGTKVPAGAYAVFTIPGKKAWTVIINRDAEQRGTGKYDEKKDVLRTKVTPTRAPMRERMTFLFADTTDAGTRLDLEWGKLRLSLPIQVQTDAQVLADIDRMLDGAWRPHMKAARYLLDTDGDLSKALGYIDTSIGLKATYYNHWVRAQILAKQNKTKAAIAAAEKALSLKEDSGGYRFYSGRIKAALKRWKK